MASKQLISNTVKAVFFATKKHNFFILFLSKYQSVNGLFNCSTLDNFIYAFIHSIILKHESSSI